MLFPKRFLSACIALVAMMYMVFGGADAVAASDDVNVLVVFDAGKIAKTQTFDPKEDIAMYAPLQYVDEKDLTKCQGVTALPLYEEGGDELVLTVPTEAVIKWRAVSYGGNYGDDYGVILRGFYLYDSDDPSATTDKGVIDRNTIQFVTPTKFLPKEKYDGSGVTIKDGNGYRSNYDAVTYDEKQLIQDNYWEATVSGVGCQPYTFYFDIIDSNGKTVYQSDWDPYVIGVLQ